ncbi:unnamed protein product [Calypogeia fissa]
MRPGGDAYVIGVTGPDERSETRVLGSGTKGYMRSERLQMEWRFLRWRWRDVKPNNKLVLTRLGVAAGGVAMAVVGFFDRPEQRLDLECTY